MDERVIDDGLLAEYEAKLAALCWETIGVVEALFVSPRPDVHEAVPCLRVVPEMGVEGQYPGKQWWQGRRVPGRQISMLSADILDVLEIAYNVPGDNLVVRGLDLEQFAPGDVLRVGEALLVVTPTPHRPCAKLAARTTATKKAALTAGKRRGLLLDAKHPVAIFIGDTVEQIVFAPAGPRA